MTVPADSDHLLFICISNKESFGAGTRFWHEIHHGSLIPVPAVGGLVEFKNGTRSKCTIERMLTHVN